jgi:hypothetical protein
MLVLRLKWVSSRNWRIRWLRVKTKAGSDRSEVFFRQYHWRPHCPSGEDEGGGETEKGNLGRDSDQGLVYQHVHEYIVFYSRGGPHTNLGFANIGAGQSLYRFAECREGAGTTLKSGTHSVPIRQRPSISAGAL